MHGNFRGDGKEIIECKGKEWDGMKGNAKERSIDLTFFASVKRVEGQWVQKDLKTSGNTL